MSNIQIGFREFKEYIPNSKPYAPRISEAEWDLHKPVLTRLRTQGLPCTEIARSVAVSHDFRPTVSQLNKRFKLWDRRSIDDELKHSATNASQMTPTDVHLAVSDEESVAVQIGAQHLTSVDLERPDFATSLAASSKISKAQVFSETNSSDEECYNNGFDRISLEQEAKRNAEDEGIAEIFNELTRCFESPFSREYSLEIISMLPLDLIKSLTCLLKSITFSLRSCPAYFSVYMWHGCQLTPGIEFNQLFLDWAYVLLISSQRNGAYEHGWLAYIFLCWKHGSILSSQKKQALLLCKRAASYMKDTPGIHALIQKVSNHYSRGNGFLHCEYCVVSLELDMKVQASRCIFLIHAPSCQSTARVSPNIVYNVDDGIRSHGEWSEISPDKQMCSSSAWRLTVLGSFVVSEIDDPYGLSEAMLYDEKICGERLALLNIFLRSTTYNRMRTILDSLIRGNTCVCLQCKSLRSDFKSGSVLIMFLVTYLLTKSATNSRPPKPYFIDSSASKPYPENLFEEGYRALYVVEQDQHDQPLSAENYFLEHLSKAVLKHYGRSESYDFVIPSISRPSDANLDAVLRYARTRHKRSTYSQVSIESSMRTGSTGGTSTVFYRLTKRLKKNPPRLERISPSRSVSSSRSSSKQPSASEPSHAQAGAYSPVYRS